MFSPNKVLNNISIIEIDNSTTSTTDEFTLYKIKNNYEVIKNTDGTFKCKNTTGHINDIIKKLENDEGCHIRIDPEKNA